MDFFLGAPLKNRAANKALFTLFTSDEKYLSLITRNQQTYLGKSLLSPLTYEELLNQKVHIISLLQRLYPEQLFSNDSLSLLV